MARVSITKAAQLAGISRTALYKTYIHQGLISISQTAQGKKYIDTAELLRVFGELQVDNEDRQIDTPKNTVTVSTEAVKDVEIAHLRSRLEDARKREQDAQEREVWYKQQIDHLTQTMKRLEAPKQAHPVYPRRWWQFWK